MYHDDTVSDRQSQHRDEARETRDYLESLDDGDLIDTMLLGHPQFLRAMATAELRERLRVYRIAASTAPECPECGGELQPYGYCPQCHPQAVAS